VKRYQLLAENSRDIILFVRPPDGRILEANDAAVRAYGYSAAELMERTVYDLRAPQTRGDVAGQMQIAEGEGILFETLHRRRSGEVFPVEVNSRGTSLQGERVLLSIIRDISDRKAAEAERDSIALFPEQNPHPVLRVGRDGALLYANPAAARLLGAHSDNTELPAPLRAQLLRSLQREAAEEIELHVEGRIYAVTCVPFLAQGYVNAYGRDITAGKQAEERLRQALTDKEVLLREVHHRTKNNLQILSDLLYLQALGCSQSEARGALEDSIGRLQAMARLHDQLYRSLESGRIRLGEYLAALVHEFGKMHQSVEFRTEVAEPGPSLDVDQAINCGLIVNELLTNAVKHAFPDAEGGEVGVRLQTHERRVVLQVWDHGKGLPEQFNMRNSASLGMRIVRLLAAALKASISVDRNEGTTFTLAFADTAVRQMEAA